MRNSTPTSMDMKCSLEKNIKRMNTKNFPLIAGLFTGAVLTVAAKRLYDQRSRERIPGIEGIDNEQVMQAFEAGELERDFITPDGVDA